MKVAVIVILWSAAAMPPLWQMITRETNSHAAARRGVAQYNHRQFDAATKSFGNASSMKPTPQNAFNLGTAQIAAGKRSEGSNTLEKAMADRSLRADALYNRGNSALASKAFEYAVRDYSEALKLHPNDAQAKRNLEIALNRLRAMQRSRGSQPQQQPGAPQQQQQKPSPSNQQRNQQRQDADIEALLRSVQQQEQEELARMKKARGESARVGW